MQLIMVGGPSLIGKSSFVDALIENDDRFARPISYTTRPRRAGERKSEYKHVSLREFKRLEGAGFFLTTDEAYGNYYAISLPSIVDTVNKGK